MGVNGKPHPKGESWGKKVPSGPPCLVVAMALPGAPLLIDLLLAAARATG